MANTIDWGKATQNNTNGFGKYQNTINAGDIYEDSWSGETTLIGTSAAFSYSKSSYHQDETDPTPTITGTTGGTFSATPSGLSINSSTGTIDLSASTIQPYTITYTVDGVSADFSLSVTASPFIDNTFSMQFDSASSQYINVGDSDNFSFTTGSSDLPFSISAWINITGTTSQGIVSKYGSSTSLREWLFYTTGGKIRLLLWNGSTNNIATSTTVLSTNTWHHVLCTYDGRGGSTAYNGINIYVNGVLESVTTSGGSYTYMSNTSQPVQIGTHSGGSFLDGKIDEVAIWNTALGETAIQEIYNATNNNTGKALDLNTDTGNYTSSSDLQYWNRMGE